MCLQVVGWRQPTCSAPPSPELTQRMSQHLDMWSASKRVTAPVSSGVLDIYNDPSEGYKGYEDPSGALACMQRIQTDSIATVAVAEVPTEEPAPNQMPYDAGLVPSGRAASFWDTIVSIVTPRGGSRSHSHTPAPAPEHSAGGAGSGGQNQSRDLAPLRTKAADSAAYQEIAAAEEQRRAAAMTAMLDMGREEEARSAARSLVLGARSHPQVCACLLVFAHSPRCSCAISKMRRHAKLRRAGVTPRAIAKSHTHARQVRTIGWVNAGVLGIEARIWQPAVRVRAAAAGAEAPAAPCATARTFGWIQTAATESATAARGLSALPRAAGTSLPLPPPPIERSIAPTDACARRRHSWFKCPESRRARRIS